MIKDHNRVPTDIGRWQQRMRGNGTIKSDDVGESRTEKLMKTPNPITLSVTKSLGRVSQCLRWDLSGILPKHGIGCSKLEGPS